MGNQNKTEAKHKVTHDLTAWSAKQVISKLSDEYGSLHPPPVHGGFLMKEGGYRKTWKRRYFILDSGLMVYSMPQDIELMGQVVLSSPAIKTCGSVFLKDYVVVDSSATG